MSLDKVFIILQSKGKFLNNFTNDNLKTQADAVWRQLEGWTPGFLIIMAVLGVGLAAYYYKPYNEQSGRHYKMSYWTLWGVISIALTFIATVCIEYLAIKTNLKSGLTSLYMLTALNNAIYCAVLYFATSVVWCLWLPTNAYRFFKP